MIKRQETIIMRLRINWTNFIGAFTLLLSVCFEFWQGVIAGALLMLGRAGIELASEWIEHRS